MENKVFGQGGKVGETDKLNIDSIIARLLEGEIKCLYFDILNKVRIVVNIRMSFMFHVLCDPIICL